VTSFGMTLRRFCGVLGLALGVGALTLGIVGEDGHNPVTAFAVAIGAAAIVLLIGAATSP